MLLLIVVVVGVPSNVRALTIKDSLNNTVNNTRSKEGKAYALLKDNGDLVFLRSYFEYADESTGIFTDIFNERYNGTCFAIEHDTSLYDYSDLVEKIYVVDGQEINGDSIGFNYPYLESVDLSGFVFFEEYGFSQMFYRCESLKHVKIGDLYAPNMTSASGMFEGCSYLESLDFDSLYAPNIAYMSNMFLGCKSLISINFDGLDTSNVVDMSGMFSGCESLESLDLSSFNTSNVENMNSMFRECSSLTSLNLNSFNTSKVADMYEMFLGCTSLTSLDLSNFNTSKVTTMSGMFCDCASLKSLDLNSFDTSRVTDMGYMFSRCHSLVQLRISNFNTARVRNMGQMFSNCSSIESLDLSNFNTSKVTYMGEMFSMAEYFLDPQCGKSSLKKLNLSSFDTSNIGDGGMYEMFYNLYSLYEIVLGNKFSVWKDDSLLPVGTWVNITSKPNIIKSEDELYENYSKNYNEWFGTWKRYYQYVEEIYFKNDVITMKTGTTITPEIIINPSTATNKMFGWRYTENDIISLDDGTITALKPGQVRLTVFTVDGSNLESDCVINVIDSDIYASSISLNKTSLSLDINKSETLVSTVKPDNTTDKKVTWTSSDTKIATVDANGKVTTKKPGTTTITASTSNGKKATCKVTVKDPVILATSISLDKTTLELENGKTATLKATVKPDNTTDKKVTWSSSDTSVVTVDQNGKLTTKKAGTATITASTSNGKKATCKVTVKAPVIEATSVSLNKTSLSLETGKSETLKATVKPDNTTNKKVTWASSNTSVATVDSTGKVTAKKAGTTTIAVKTSNGKTATCKITVKDIDACEIGGYIQNLTWRWDDNYKSYWCENGVTQGLYGQNGNVWYDNIERGREIYDPASKAWYWLDSLYDGAKAENKEVFMPYIYSNEDGFSEVEKINISKLSDTYTESYFTANMSEQVYNAIKNKTGKWVRYDAYGRMIKGWYTVQGDDVMVYPDQIGNTYFYDYQTGLMAKGWTTIDGVNYFFDEITGVLQ